MEMPARIDDMTVDKEKFDALLQKLIQSKPTTAKQAKEAPKLRKDGQPKRHRTVRKTENRKI